MRRPHPLLQLLLLLLGPLLAACPKAPSTPTVDTAAGPRYGGVLRAGMQTDPVGLDPHTTNSTATRNLLENVYDTLVALDPQGRIVPALAASWSQSADGRRWTFHLRPGVTFHDGSPLRASDAAFSLRRLKDPRLASPRAEDFAAVQEARALDDQTLELTLGQPYGPLLAKLAYSMNAVVSEAAVRKYGDLQHVAIGTGPFTLREYVPQTRMTLGRYPHCWQRDERGAPLPYLDAIEFRFLPDANARTVALRTGHVDWIEYVPAADVQALQRDPAIVVQGGVATNFRSLILNTRVPPLDDVRVRQALAHAIDTRAVVDMALFGVGGVAAAGTAVPPGSPYAIGDSPYQRRDLGRARALLAEAGYPHGFAIALLVTSTYDFLRAPAEVIQANLADIGVHVRLRVLDWSLFLPEVLAHRFEMTVMGESGLSDPDDFLYEMLHSRGGQNLGSFADPAIDALLDGGRRTGEPLQRRLVYEQAQRLILAAAPHVFLFHSAQHEAFRRTVRGYQHAFNTSYLGLRTTWLQ
jgi:peptide/nickel transport system substrate-binding protein